VGHEGSHQSKASPSLCLDEAYVRFNLKNVTVHPGFTRSELSEEEYKALWYGRSELVRIHASNRKTVERFAKKERAREQHCIRGLEHQLEGQSDLRKDKIVGSVYAVLQEQARQVSEEWSVNEEKIANVYRDYTQSCEAVARQMALQDEIYVTARQGTAKQKQKLQQAVLRFADDDLSLRTVDSSESGASRSRPEPSDKNAGPMLSTTRKEGGLSRFMKGGRSGKTQVWKIAKFGR
jgi:hypothetical protein